MMEKVILGKTGLHVSQLGFGAAPIGYLNINLERVATVLNLLLDEGVNLIDTAASYEGSEALIGKTVGPRREEYVLVSKCGPKIPGLGGEAWSPELIHATINRSLQRLDTEFLDVMLLHSCDLETLQQGDALGALIEAKEAGKIRFAGYSGDNDAAAWAAAQPDVSVIETSVNLCDQYNIEHVLPVCREHKVGVLAKRPIANAAWKEIGDQQGLYQAYAATYTKRFRLMDLNHTELGFSGSADAAWPEIALRFTLSQPGVHSALIGTTNPGNARANVQAVLNGPLPEETVRTIRRAFREAQKQAGTTWLGQT